MRHFLEKTSKRAFNILLQSTHDISWSLGPFGEQFGVHAFLFLGSQAQLQSAPPMEDAMMLPLQHEASISIDWSLTMTEGAQERLFDRIQKSFNNTTALVPLNAKKEYRMAPEELTSLRNLIVLYDQLSGHMKSRLPDEEWAAWETDVRNGAKRDADLLHLLQLRPSRFAMSLLPSRQEAAKKEVIEAEERKVEAKEIEKQEVTMAQWNFFKGALKRDHSKMELVQNAPRLVRMKLHAKMVNFRAKQAAEGETACRVYQDRTLKRRLNHSETCCLSTGPLSR